MLFAAWLPTSKNQAAPRPCRLSTQQCSTATSHLPEPTHLLPSHSSLTNPSRAILNNGLKPLSDNIFHTESLSTSPLAKFVKQLTTHSASTSAENLKTAFSYRSPLRLRAPANPPPQRRPTHTTSLHLTRFNYHHTSESSSTPALLPHQGQRLPRLPDGVPPVASRTGLPAIPRATQRTHPPTTMATPHPLSQAPSSLHRQTRPPTPRIPWRQSGPSPCRPRTSAAPIFWDLWLPQGI